MKKIKGSIKDFSPRKLKAKNLLVNFMIQQKTMKYPKVVIVNGKNISFLDYCWETNKSCVIRNSGAFCANKAVLCSPKVSLALSIPPIFLYNSEL